MIYIASNLSILHNTAVNSFVPRLLPYHIIKGMNSVSRNLDLQHSSCVISGKSINFFVPQFPHI